MNTLRFLSAWGRILQGRPPMLSIEITRECPLHCPGCYAYDDRHLGGGVTLRQLRDSRGDALVDGVLHLVRVHQPVHLSIVGGEPLVRHRELGRILPEVSAMRVETLVVTSGVIPIPRDWNALPHIRIAVSIDGLQPDHDKRRAPATYDRILANIPGRRVDVSWVITRSQLERPGYLDEYLEFWSARPEVDRIWLNLYTPQLGEQSREMITPVQRQALIPELLRLSERYPALLMTPGIANALATPPANPDQCVFSRVSVNYSADLKTRVQPCFFGGARLPAVRLCRDRRAALDREETPARPHSPETRDGVVDCHRQPDAARRAQPDVRFRFMRCIRGSVPIVVFLSVLSGGVLSLAQSKPTSVPRFEIDPFWPKPLPDTWEMGELGAVFVDSKDHVWVISRPRTLTPDQIGLSLTPPTSECCVPAPPVIEFDQEGRIVQSWGGPGPGYEWPANEHGIFVDYKGNVWLGGNTAKQDSQILKFTHDGKFLMQIGHAKTSKGSLDTENLNRPAQIWVWEKTNEVFVADGYQNRRVIVFDADTGKFKRMWGAYGNKPDDSVSRDRVNGSRGSEQFNIVHGVSIANDGLVYVSDRINNRIQVFTLDGAFVKEGFIARGTLDSRGTAFAVAFSPDKEQRFLVVPDGANDKVRILDRQTLQVLDSWGRPGPYAGQWHWLHSLAVDSKGNLYTAESRGNRLQKFVNKGTKPVSIAQK